MPVLNVQKRKIEKGWGQMDCYEGFEDLKWKNQELIESISDDSSVCPLERIIYLEEIKIAIDSILLLTNKELVVFMMRNYDKVSFGKIRKYFIKNRGEEISGYVLRNIEKTAFRKIRRNLNFTYDKRER